MEEKGDKTMTIPLIEFEPIPQEEEYVICYIDVLGTRNLTYTNNDIFKKIYETYSFCVEVESKTKMFGDLQFKVFSDNILIAKKVEDNNSQSVFVAYKKIVNFLKTFIPNFICEGILLRGGITFGRLSINNTIVWGSGLIEVVDIEEKFAIYPRIIVSDKLRKIFLDMERNTMFEEKFSCLFDIDGSMFVDYMPYGELPTAKKVLEESRKVIIEKISKETNQRTIQKYKWHANYLKRACEIFNEIYFDIGEKINFE